MKACSAATRAADPYRAGLELGAALRDCRPEVVFLFSSIHYSESNELLEGLYESIGRDDLVLIGATGDGFYEGGSVGDVGASVLALDSCGEVRWHLVHGRGLGQDAAGTTRSVLARMHARLGDKAAFMYLAADFRMNASDIERVIEHETDVPVIGGFAADDNRMERCAVYANREVLTDTVALLAAEGPVDIRIIVGNGLKPVGRPGVVDVASGMDIHQINGISAMQFIEAETGKPVLTSDLGIISLTIIDPDLPEIKRLRSIVPALSTDQQALGLYGGVEPGCTVQVCLAQPDQIVREVAGLVADARQSGFKPAAALVVSCVGRKWLLGERAGQEARALAECFGDDLPAAGYPSFGEFAPLVTAGGYSRNLFHNMTYVLLLIGRA